jgi:hypothetical protein
MSNSIQAFWDVIRQHHQLFSIPDNDKDDEMMIALRSLQKIDPRLYFHCGYLDESVDLLISAEGHYDLSDTISAIIDSAPELVGWRFRPILESGALSGDRDQELFPDDENGDVLFGIAQRAGNLITPADVDFCHVFPSEMQARSFAASLDRGFEQKTEPYDGREDYTWEVVATRRMIPSHSHITTTELALADLAAIHDGSPDGWGFMSS